MTTQPHWVRIVFWPQLNDHLIMSQSEDYRVEDGLEDDEGVADGVEEKPLHWVHITVAPLAPLQIVVVNIVIVILRMSPFDI